MTITDLVAPEAILPALKVNSKKQALQELAAKAAALTGQNERVIFEVLLQREKLGTTAVGYGVAIPHGKLPKLEKLFGLFARCQHPIDFESMDSQLLIVETNPMAVPSVLMLGLPTPANEPRANPFLSRLPSVILPVTSEILTSPC